MNNFMLRGADNLTLALFCLSVIRFLRLPGATEGIENLILQTLGVGANVTVVPVTADLMSWVRIRFPGLCLICMDGGTTLTQYSNILRSYSARGDYPTFGFASNYLADCASNVYDASLAATYLPAPRVIIAGHSLGGSAMIALGAKIKHEWPDSDLSVLTFGSPRSGGRELAQRYSVIDVARYMNDMDPAPLIPPHVGDSRVSLVTFEPRIQLQWNQTIHVRGGSLIHADGSITEADKPPLEAWSADQSILSLLIQMGLQQITYHSVPGYAFRIAKALEAAPESEPFAPGRNHSEATDPTTVKKINKQIATAVEPVRLQGEQQGAIPVRIPRSNAFRPERRGGIWVTVFNDRVVGIGPKEGRARSMARNGNRLLRSMQPMSVLSVGEMLGAWDQYFGAASDPTKGFTPPLKTDFD